MRRRTPEETAAYLAGYEAGRNIKKRAPDVDELAQFIRVTDGNNTMGASVLAEKICEWLERSKP